MLRKRAPGPRLCLGSEAEGPAAAGKPRWLIPGVLSTHPPHSPPSLTTPPNEQVPQMKVAQSCLTLHNPMDLHSPCNSLGQNTGMGSLSLFQGIFPTQGLKPGLPHCRQILYQLSHQGNPRILEWVAYLFSSGSS